MLFPTNEIYNCEKCGKFYSKDKSIRCSIKNCTANKSRDKRVAYTMNLMTILFILGFWACFFFWYSYATCCEKLSQSQKENTILQDSLYACNIKLDAVSENAKFLMSYYSKCDSLQHEVDSLSSIKPRVVYVEKKKVNFSQCEIDCMQLSRQ